MANLSAARDYTVVGHPDQIEVLSAGNMTHYKGMLLILDSSGYAAVPSDGAAQWAAGIYTGMEGTALAVASGSHDKLTVERGMVWCYLSGAAQTDVGNYVFLADSGNLTLTAGSKTVKYLAIAQKTNYLLVDLRTATL